MAAKRLLVAFDFDDTLIDANSDIVVQKLSPGPIPPEIKAQRSDTMWTKFMGAVFGHLHYHGVTPSQILHCMEQIPFTPGMLELLSRLTDARADVIIISDSNSVFIEHILKSAGVTVAKVYTNPARFDEAGLLHIEGYHVQDWCKMSTVNLCKGHILSTYLEERARQGVEYSRVAYVGDGSNDYCPALRLKKDDVVFPRVGFKLVKLIEEKGEGVVAKVVPWTHGREIWAELSSA